MSGAAAELTALAEQGYRDQAKRLLRENLSTHPDAGVRALNEIVEIPDDHPGVVHIAASLRALAAVAGGGVR